MARPGDRTRPPHPSAAAGSVPPLRRRPSRGRWALRGQPARTAPRRGGGRRARRRRPPRTDRPDGPRVRAGLLRRAPSRSRRPPAGLGGLGPPQHALGRQRALGGRPRHGRRGPLPELAPLHRRRARRIGGPAALGGGGSLVRLRPVRAGGSPSGGAPGSRRGAWPPTRSSSPAADWALGQATIDVGADGHLVCRFRRHGRDHVGMVRPVHGCRSGRWSNRASPSPTSAVPSPTAATRSWWRGRAPPTRPLSTGWRRGRAGRHRGRGAPPGHGGPSGPGLGLGGRGAHLPHGGGVDGLPALLRPPGPGMGRSRRDRTPSGGSLPRRSHGAVRTRLRRRSPAVDDPGGGRGPGGLPGFDRSRPTLPPPPRRRLGGGRRRGLPVRRQPSWPTPAWSTGLGWW